MNVRESDQSSIDLVLHGMLGTVFAVAVAVLALWPHVQTLVV